MVKKRKDQKRTQDSAMVVVDRNDVFPSSGVNELSLCSWNMLAPCLHEEHPGSLKWSCRRSAWQRCVEQVATCDILCFQEVDRDCVADDLTNMLAKFGYAAVLQEQKGRTWGNATFFKTQRLRLIWSESRSRTLCTGFALPDGCVIGVVNVHLEAGSTETNEAQRVSMLTSALRRLREYAPLHVIVAGDFNSSLKHDSELRDLLIATGLCRVPTRGLTFAVPGYADVLDHIWTSESFHVSTVFGSTTETLDSIASEGMPNSRQPSDHLPVAAKFHFQDCGIQDSGMQSGKASSAQLFFNGMPCDSSMVASMCHEWVLIMDHARRAMSEGQNRKKAIREQRDLEKAFIEAMGEEAGTFLRKCHAKALEAAQSAVAAAISNAQACMNETQALTAQTEKCSTRDMKDQSESDAPTFSKQYEIWDPGIFAWTSLMARFLSTEGKRQESWAWVF
jgi:endonuclease/exonuclease/phosphatase family metal-dependent hydrolase